MFTNVRPKGLIATVVIIGVCVLYVRLHKFPSVQSNKDISHSMLLDNSSQKVGQKDLVEDDLLPPMVTKKYPATKGEISIPAIIRISTKNPRQDVTGQTNQQIFFRPENVKSILHTTSAFTTTRPPYCHNYQMDSWEFKCVVPCRPVNIYAYRGLRNQLNVFCVNDKANLQLTTTQDTNFVPEIPFNSTCSLDLIDTYCSGDVAVPNIIHYVWFSKRKMNVYHYISFLSAFQFMKPCLILVHGDFRPFGEYWEYLLQQVPNIFHVSRPPPTYIYGKRIIKVEHQADIARLEALKVYGGIYLDTDEVILRSLDDLRHYPFTLSHAIDTNLSNGLILSAANATFLTYWLNGYKTFDPNEWAYHSTILPYKLSKIHPELIHVENKTFVRPNYTQMSLLVNANFDWTKNYAIHLYIRYVKSLFTIGELRHLNNTIGSVARHVIFGSKELCAN